MHGFDVQTTWPGNCLKHDMNELELALLRHTQHHSHSGPMRVLHSSFNSASCPSVDLHIAPLLSVAVLGTQLSSNWLGRRSRLKPSGLSVEHMHCKPAGLFRAWRGGMWYWSLWDRQQGVD